MLCWAVFLIWGLPAGGYDKAIVAGHMSATPAMRTPTPAMFRYAACLLVDLRWLVGSLKSAEMIVDRYENTGRQWQQQTTVR